MSVKALYDIFQRSEGVTTDSRHDIHGKLFFALRGERYDGHAFVRQSLEKGCYRAVIDDERYAADERTVKVDNVLSSLQALAAYHRKRFDIPVIAITGSNGKTTTKELMRDVLGRLFRTLATEGNLNNHIGVPLTLLRLRKEHEIAVIEMGANHIGEIDLLCRIARPDHGLITNIGRAHLEGFGSLQGVFRAKGELFRYLKSTGGKAFVNNDQDLLSDLARELELDAIYYGSSGYCNVRGRLTEDGPGTGLEVAAGNPPSVYNVKSSLAGSYNFENILAAVCVGDHFKVPPDQIINAVGEYIPGNNRSQIMQTARNRILLDAYNANPDSMRSALLNFTLQPGENKSVILGDMLELGRYEEEEHMEIVRLINGHNYREVILVGSAFSRIPLPKDYIHFENTGLLIEWLAKNPVRDRFVLLKGSRGIGLERCLPLL
ncbi:MAG: UDP-N-acetylmuramoyl-tripeptide--D-alanyl-D-alanine ligase [Marinilabiliales bacterium]|nr:MAG: UDP-N-acetylmuramoyl-tripeptide--D-alanyl-D-alanine ligase [Marinilabiliales bacterium]